MLYSKVFTLKVSVAKLVLSTVFAMGVQELAALVADAAGLRNGSSALHLIGKLEKNK